MRPGAAHQRDALVALLRRRTIVIHGDILQKSFSIHRIAPALVEGRNRSASPSADYNGSVSPRPPCVPGTDSARTIAPGLWTTAKADPPVGRAVSDHSRPDA